MLSIDQLNCIISNCFCQDFIGTFNTVNSLFGLQLDNFNIYFILITTMETSFKNYMKIIQDSRILYCLTLLLLVKPFEVFVQCFISMPMLNLEAKLKHNDTSIKSMALNAA